MPAQLTPFIGRAKERADVARLLLEEGVRLLTLTGPPGIGKTRLSIQVASDLLRHFPDGAYFVPLASITDPALVPSAIGEHLDIRQTGQQPLPALIAERLRDKELLLLLDNFEQVVQAGPPVKELLEACPHLKVLVTSRQALRVTGEQELPVPPLNMPGHQDYADVGALSRYEAVSLFTQRARAVKPDFALTGTNGSAVARICVQLDGLPLAIELAAARAKLLPPQAMLLRLAHGSSLLASGAQDLPARQRTLHNAIAWSYDLLSEEEKMLFRRLGVFAGGFTLEAAEGVCNSRGDLGLSTLEGLALLLDKSLLKPELAAGSDQETGIHDEPRFMMLETIKHFAREKLEESGEALAVRRLHATFFLSLVESSATGTSDTEEIAWLKRLEVEHDNLRAALNWLLVQGDLGKIASVSSALKRFWLIHGHLVEGQRVLEAVLAQGDQLAPEVRAQVSGDAGFLAWRSGNLPLARSLLEKALELKRQIGDEKSIGRGLDGLGMLALHEDDSSRAIELFTESLVMARSSGDSMGVAGVLNHLGEMWRKEGDYGRAAGLYNESLQLAREEKETWTVGLVSHNLGQIALQNSDYTEASTLFEESIKSMRELGSEFGVAQALLGWAGLSVRLGMMERAGSLLGAFIAMRGRSEASLDPADRDEYEHSLGAVREWLGEARFEKAWAEGQAMTLEQAVHYALQTPQSVPQMTTTREDLSGLTKRELEVASLIAQSNSNSEIAEALVLSKRTVETHITNILSKLGFTSRGQIAAWALKRGLAGPPD